MRKLLYESLLVFLMVLCFQNAKAQNTTISGVITDNANLPVPSVIVKEKGTKAETITDENGAFTISVREGATLIVSSIGYKTAELKAADGMKIRLASGTNELDGVTVTALGQSKKNKSIGYATSVIKADAIVKTASPTIANALYGKAPGVRISSTPGGAGAINIQIRGINSLTGRNQPLIIMDGVPIRNGEVGNSDYWNQPRIKSNGLADINPEDIENISILKGASAAALYGSEAVNGVVLITSKSGKGKKGLGIDFSTSYSGNQIAYLPRFQYERGPGWTNGNFSSGYLAPDGFDRYDTDGDGVKETRGVSNSSVNFGPWFDGQPIMSWDGVMRPYSAQRDGYKNMFQNAWDATTNFAISNNTENSNIRFSYTHIESEGLSMNNNNKKNNFNLNASFKTGKLKTDVIVSYLNQNVENRSVAMDRLVNNFTGMMSPFDNGDWYKAKYQTSLGYKYVTGLNGQSLTPNENIIRNGFKADIGDFFWNTNANKQEEITNRVIASLTETFSITNDLSIRGRISTDLTAVNTETKNPVEKPLIYGFGPGSYKTEAADYNVLYGELIMTYNKKINDDFTAGAMFGYSGTERTDKYMSRSTENGLSVEGWYDINSSVGLPSGAATKSTVLNDALFGTVNGSYKNFLFLEGTLRRDRTSTMNPDKNAFTYPSVNTSFILSEAVKLPEFINYAKMRGSWGIVGSYPEPLLANIAFSQVSLGTQGTAGPVLSTTSNGAPYGNEGIKPEMKHEIELGFETKFLDRRLGLDFSFYTAKIKDQIIKLTLPSTTGASSILTNVGELSNKGFEVALTGTPIRSENFSWDVTLNWSKNINKVTSLSDGSNEIVHADYDGSAAQLKSVVGETMGGIYAHPVKTDASGNKMVDSDGFYMLDGDKWEKYGTAIPDGVGGLINSLTYKNFTLDIGIDYSYGGYLMPTGINWMNSRGLTEESLKYSTNDRGGLTYYMDNGKGVQVPNSATAGPGGQPLYRDGMLMDGIAPDGSKNTNVVSQAGYYALTYNWGGPQYESISRYELYIQKNDYVKLRELSLMYNVPSSYASKIGATKLSLSFFGRNLFYIYRTIKDMDSEATTSGTKWDQNVNNSGITPATRSYGVVLRASF